MKQKYVNVLTDSGFKALFGDENNKEVVKFIINTLLPSEKKISIIKYLPTEQQGAVIGINKEFHYDFMCEDEKGSKFIVEMQQYHDKYWFQRCVSYASRTYDRQNKIGGNYNIPPVYLIGLMGVEVNHPDKEYWKNRYLSEYTYREKGCHDLLEETIFIIFAELANFNKSELECETDLDKVMYLLKNLGRMQAQPQGFEQKQFTDIINACEIAGFDEVKRTKYDKEMKDADVMKSIVETAREMGEAKGKAEGKVEEQKNIALNLLKMGLPIEQISEATTLSIEEIERLK